MTTASEDQMNELRVLKIEQVAELVQLSSRTVMRAIQSGELEASQLTKGRGGWRVKAPAIAAWLQARSNQGPERPLAVPRPLETASQPRRPSSGRHRTTDRERLRI